KFACVCWGKASTVGVEQGHLQEVSVSVSSGRENVAGGKLALSLRQEVKCLLADFGLARLPPSHPAGDVVAPPPAVSLIDGPLPERNLLPTHQALRLFWSMIRSRSCRSNRSFLSRSTVGILPR